MTNLKPDSPLSRRIVLSFLDFLNSVEPSSGSDIESLEVAKDCLSEVFKIDSSSTSCVPKSDSLVQIFSPQKGQNNEIKSNEVGEKSQADTSHVSVTNKASADDTNPPGDTRTIGLHEDELFGQFFGALEKVHYFGNTPSGDDEQALDRATHLFHNALMEMKKSGCGEIDLKNLADTFKLQGNKAMQSKLYSEAIELYTVAIALRDDNAIYYCNRAAAYTQMNKYTEAIHDCHKSIAIDPNYSKAYSRLGFTYYAQGNYKDAIDKGFKKALQLDPNNESVRGNIQAAEHKLREQQRGGHGESSSSWSYSNGGSSRSHGPIPTFTGFPTNLAEPFDWSSMVADMQPGESEPGIRIGMNPGIQMPEEIYGVLRSAMQMFQEREGTQDESNENGNENSSGDGNENRN